MTRFVLIAIVTACTLLPTPAAMAQSTDIYRRPLQAERSRTYDALHYKVHLRFDESTRSFFGTNTITLSPLHDGFTKAVLDAETFVVTSATDAQGDLLRFEQMPHSLVVHFDAPHAYGDTLTFTVAYEAHDVDVDGEAFGVSASYDLGLGFKEATEDNPQLINTLSFPRGARHWMPCYDHPNDRATNETLITVSTDYQALSNGRLVSVTEAGDGLHTYHWLQELPHPTYLYVLVAGPYVVLEDSLGSLPVNYWVYPKDVDDAMRSFHRTPEILQFLTDVYGVPYPWIKYDQVTIPGIGGGAESTTATVLGQSTIHDENAEQDFPSDWLVAHEAAHQWWGNLISYRDWPETWLSESFATYSEYIWARYAHGADEGAVNLLRKKASYFNEARTRYVRPVVFHRWEYPNHNFDRHTYQKGAVILEMLSSIMGERNFQRAQRHFLTKHAFQPVETQDLMVAIKEATGQNLDWFFDQWIFRAGHPVLEVSTSWDATGNHLALNVAQVHDTLFGVPAAYRLPVTVRMEAEGDTLLREEIWLTRRSHEFIFTLSQKPDLVRFDDGDRLLAEWTHSKSIEELLYQLRRDNALGRAWAAREIAEHVGAPHVQEALLVGAEHDPFWHVRVAAIEAVGGAASDEFLKARSLDSHSNVRAAALRTLGDRRQAAHVEFFKARFDEDDSYVARAEALRSLGKVGEGAVRAFLEAAAQVKSPRNVVRTAAEWALGQL